MNPELFTASSKNNNGTNKKRIILGIVITVVAIAGIAAAVVLILPLFKGNTAAPQTATPPITSIRANVDERKDIQKDQTAKFGYFDVKISKVTRDYKPGGGISPSQKGYVFLLLNLSATNTSDEPHLLSDIELGVLSGQEILYPTLSVRAEPVLKTGSIDAGQTVTGNLVFEVPSTDKDLKLYYNTQMYNYEEEKLKKTEYTLAF